MDCFGGEIISLAMDDNMKKELCIKAAKEAYKLRKPKSGFLFHSDAGSQYTSLKGIQDFIYFLKQNLPCLWLVPVSFPFVKACFADRKNFAKFFY